MAKGTIAKKEFFDKVMEIFPNSFMYNGDKELRVNLMEDGEEVQLKIVATCSKTPVSLGETIQVKDSFPANLVAETREQNAEITEEEKARVAEIWAALGL